MNKIYLHYSNKIYFQSLLHARTYLILAQEFYVYEAKNNFQDIL